MTHVLTRFVLLLQLAALVGVALVVTQPAASATLPNGFAETQVATGLAAPTAMAFAPDGRLFVAEQGGRLRVIKNGTLLGMPFLTLNVNSSGERGLLGIAFDPNFAVNQYVYVYYTTASSPIHNRLSRFTAMGDIVAPGPETVIMDLENLTTATNHNGGAIHFGPDGALYVAVGDNANGANSQTLGNRLGKILRINADGTIPTTNPFYGTATGVNRSIWALGLRNPFTFTFQQGSSRMFINDVGQNAWEEIDDGIAGSNYGWPETEGSTTDPRFRSPLYSYGHGSGATTGCAITGGAFYNAPSMPFPSDYAGDYFFADYCSGWIRRFDPANGSVTGFASGAASPVDLTVANDGSLYYLARGSGGSVFRVAYTASQAPTITTHPSSQTVPAGGTATFTVAASGTPPLSYQWQRNGVDIPGATSASYTLSDVTVTDSGATFRARVTNSAGSVTSNAATLTVTANQAPTATITQPAAGSLYSGGQTISYSGTGLDPEIGNLPASAFTWQVDFHHASHVHPFVAPTSGATSGSFVVPTVGHTESDVWYRIILTVRDPAGLTSTVFRDVQPRKANLTFATSPPGLSIRLDSQPQTTPLTVTGVVGIERTLEAPSPQTLGGTTYEFDRWSDGGARVHTISTPASNTTYTAFFREVTGGDGLSATYYDNQNLTGTTVNRVDSTRRLRLGRRRARHGDRSRHVQRPLGRDGAAADQWHLHVLHRERRRRPPVGRRPPPRRQLDRSLADRELGHDRADRRRQVRRADGVLRERRRRGRPPALERAFGREGGHSAELAVLPLRREDQLPAGGDPGTGRLPRGYRRRLRPAVERRALRMERRQRRADPRPERGQLAGSALRHAHAPAEAGESQCGLGAGRSERDLHGARRRRRREPHRQRLPAERRGGAHCERDARAGRRAGSRARRR